MENCLHHIPMIDACPWCGRKSSKPKIVEGGEAWLKMPKKPFQTYQATFNRFLNYIAPMSHGHFAISIVATDLNGTTYTLIEGPFKAIEHHVAALDERVKRELSEHLKKGKPK